MDAFRCESCGFRELRQESFEDGIIEICELCEHPHGPEDLLERYRDVQEAGEAGIDLVIWPLYKILRNWKEVKLGKASSGEPSLVIPPYVYFGFARNTLKPLEKLSISLEMAARKMHSRWVLEASFDRHFHFCLRPMFFGLTRPELTDAIRLAQKDIPTLAASLKRDMNLNWWSQRELGQ